MKTIILLSLLIISNSAYANCITGFACSIEDIEKKEKEKLQTDIKIYKKYLQDNKKDIILTGLNMPVKYKDLFVFKPFV